METFDQQSGHPAKNKEQTMALNALVDDSVKVVILTAFYITKKLFESRKELTKTINTMEEKTANILKMLEDSTLIYSASGDRGDTVSLT